MRYMIVIEKTATGYSTYAPDLPGCVATGATVDEVRTLIEQAIRLHIDGLRKDGEPVPDPQTLSDSVEAA